MTSLRHLSYLTAILCLPISAAAQSTMEVSRAYLAANGASDYDRAREYMADDLIFEDPTGDVFEGPVGQGAINGADQFVALQRTWGIERSDFDPEVSFAIGEYAVHWGTNVVTTAQGQNSIPFATVHRVVEGKLAERMDFGEYIASFGLGDGFDDSTTWTQVVADQYLQAYFDEDFDAQVTLASDDIWFQDPTARVFGPESGKQWSGKESLIGQRRRVFAQISDFGMDVDKAIYANHHAMYKGTIHYTVQGGRTFEQDALIVVEVKDQVVTRHWDFVNYGQQ